MAKGTRCCFEINNILTFSFILVIAISFISNSFSENQSKPNLNDFKLNQFFNSTQTYANSKLKGNFFLLKDNDIYVPINFYSNNKNIFNNAIYEKDKNHLTLILNHPVYNENSLILQIPRNILDSKTKDNKDDNFTVLLNNKPSKYVEINNKSLSAINLNPIEDIQAIRNIINDTANRIISIKFDKDSKVIKISGTDQSENQSKIPKMQNQMHIIFPLVIENKIKYLASYIEGGYLTDIKFSQNSLENKTLEVFLNPIYIDGNLIIQIPRNILDSKTKDNKDDNFTVLLNNKPSKYVEINNKSLSAINLNPIEDIQAIRNIINDTANRIISIKFDKDSKVIKISGTDQSENQSKIPKITNKINNEFSFINSIITIIIILTIAITTMFFLYKNGKLRFIKTFKFKR